MPIITCMFNSIFLLCVSPVEGNKGKVKKGVNSTGTVQNQMPLICILPQYVVILSVLKSKAQPVTV